MTISNGITWTDGAPGFYYIDSPTRRIQLVTASGDGAECVTAFDLSDERGVPDGMTSDADGYLYVAMWGGGVVLQCDPRRGRIVGRIEIPATYVTSCAFGDDDYRALYVTSASWAEAGESEEQPGEDLGGSVFRVPAVGPGRAEPIFNL